MGPYKEPAMFPPTCTMPSIFPHFPISVPSSCMAYSFILKIEAAGPSGSLVNFLPYYSKLSALWHMWGIGCSGCMSEKTLTETTYKVKTYFHSSSRAGVFICDIVYWWVKDFSYIVMWSQIRLVSNGICVKEDRGQCC
jgi:hypothetical protein